MWYIVFRKQFCSMNMGCIKTIRSFYRYTKLKIIKVIILWYLIFSSEITFIKPD